MSLFQAAQQRARFRNETLPQTTAHDPASWLRNLWSGTDTPSGVKVDPDNAISLSTVFNALTLLSESVAQLPVAPYLEFEEDGMQKRRKYKEHFSYPIVADSPNRYMNSDTFRKTMMNHLCRYDRAYAIISRNGNAQASSLFPIHPEWVDTMIYTPKNGEPELIYRVTNYYDNGKEELIRDMNMFHLIGYTDNGLEGKSRIDIVADGIGNAKAAERFAGSFFGKGVNVSGFIQHPGKLKDEESVQRLKSSFAKATAGPNNEHGVGVLEEGAEWQPNEVEPQKAQLNETRKVNGQVVAQIWNIPLSFLKYLDSTSYSEAEQEDLKFSKYTLTPWLVAWEKEYKRKLLTEREKRQGNIYFKHNMKALLRGDMESRANFYESMSKTGAYSPNKILELEDENGYNGGDLHMAMPGAQSIESLKNVETNEE